MQFDAEMVVSSKCPFEFVHVLDDSLSQYASCAHETWDLLQCVMLLDYHIIIRLVADVQYYTYPWVEITTTSTHK